jgi:hypothetical protein
MGKETVQVIKWIVLGIIGLVLFISLGSFISNFNREKDLRTQFNAQISSNQADFDNMYKVIAQKYQVKGDFENTFKTVVSEAAKGREGGSLAKFVQENYPTMDTSIYKEMMATIEGKRDEFTSRQRKMVDIKREHDYLISRFPTNLMLFWVQPLELKLVTSSKTEKAYQTGKDDDIKL